MSQFMKSFAPRGSRSQGPSRPLQANIALQITGHDLSAPDGGVVLGVVRTPDWMAGDEVAIRLCTPAEGEAGFRKNYTPQQNKKFFEKTRPTIEKLMTGFRVGNNDVEPMLPGGILMMYGCTKAGKPEEGQMQVWKAQYAENFGNDATRDVFHAAARLTVDKGNDQRNPRAHMDLLFPGDARVIKDIDQLKAFYDETMMGEMNGVAHSANAVLRLIVPGSEQNQVKSVWTYSARRDVVVPPAEEGGEERKFQVPASAEETWREAVEEGKHGKGMVKVIAAALKGDYAGLEGRHVELAKDLKADLDSGQLILEAIPGRRIPVVGKTLEDVLDEDSKLAKAAARGLVATDKDTAAPGFIKMTVGVMTSRSQGGALPDSIIVTKFAPDEFARGRSIDYLATPNHAPRFTKEREKAAEQEAAQAHDAGGVQHSALESKADQTPDPAADRRNDNDGPSR